VLQLQARQLLPGHGERIEEAESAIRTLIEHRLEREAQILAELRSGPTTAEAIARRLYAAYPQAVQGMAAGTVLAHLIKLEADGRVGRLEGDSGDRFEVVSPG
jgi:hypothetical protein